MTRTLRGRLVLLLGAVVAAACVLLAGIAVFGSAFLMRRAQDRTLAAMATGQCEGILSEAREHSADVVTGADEYFKEVPVAGYRVELTDSHDTTLAFAGDLDGRDPRAPRSGRGRFRVLSVPCGGTFIVRVIARDVLFEAPVGRAGRTLLGALPIAVGIGMVLCGVAVARALRPLDDLEQAAARLQAGSPLSLGVGARPLELARLERSFDGLLQRLGAALARERRFTQEASHELRTPLTVLRARIELCDSARSDEERKEHLAAIVKEVDSLEMLVDALLLLARAEDAPLPGVPVNLCDLVRSAVHRQGLIDGGTGGPIEVEAPDEILVRGSEELLDRAIGNLVENARKFSGPGGRIRVRVGAVPGHGVISVADDGPGIAREARAQVFERFHRDPAQRHASNGAGLGLAVVRAIVVRHGGKVSAGASDLGGAELRLELPLL